MSGRTSWETGARPAATIARPRVVSLLESAVERPVVLVVAPAGHGKTVAVRQWLAARAGPDLTVWVDAGRVAGRPRAFVAEVLRQASQTLGVSAPVDVFSDDLTVDALLDDGLIALQQVPGDVDIVLDGIDAVGDDIISLVQRLVHHLLGHWRVVMTSRTTPAIGVARLRAALALEEIGPDELRFDVQEATALLRGGLGLDVSERSIEEVTRRLGGWAAGLVLVGLSAARDPDPESILTGVTGRHPWIDGYLSSELLPVLEDDLRRFLVDTAPLRRLSVELCDHVTGRHDARTHLATLRTWPTVSVEHTPSGIWLRHDEVVGTWLRAVAERTSMGDVHVTETHAAQWCRDHDLLADAVAYAVAAGDAELIGEVLGAHGYGLLHRDAQIVRVALEALPPEILHRSPEFWLLGADASIAIGDAVRATILADRAREAAADLGEPRASALRRGVALHDVTWHLREGRLTQSARALRALTTSTPRRPPDVVMHAGWDQQRVQFLGDLASSLTGRRHRPRSPAVCALVASRAGEDAMALTLARRALAGEPSTLDGGTERLLAALALAWSGTDADLADAHQPTRATAADDWWLNQLLRELVAVEAARRAHRWRSVRQHLEQAQHLLDDLTDPAVVPELLVGHVMGRIEEDTTGRVPALTEREVDVLQELAVDRSRREVARRLHLSQNTVKTHLRSAYRKLGVESRAEAIARARGLGLLRTSSSDGTSTLGPSVEDGGATP